MLRLTRWALCKGSFLRVHFKTFSVGSTCYYEILGVAPTATNAEIKDAFMRLSKKYHPDVTSCSNAHENFVRINEAYSVLSRDASRKDYDFRQGFSRISRNPFRPVNPGQAFRSANPGHSEEMYQQWYRTVYNKRRTWTPQDDFGPDTAPSNDSMRKGFVIISVLLALALIFQMSMLSRNQERHHKRLMNEKIWWDAEMKRQSGDRAKKKISSKDIEKEEEDIDKKV